MIVKDRPAHPHTDPLRRAGDRAETQMAHYLKRAFASDPAVHVFHDLRLEHEGEVAQLDHLILHRSGAIVVESKSVTSAVRINERDEWARLWNGRWTGMPSPVLQARRQADHLRKLLDAHREALLGTFMFGLVQKGFGAFIVDVVVAISDDGVVEHRGTLAEVRKADQVPDRVKALMQEHQRLARPLSADPRSKAWGLTISPEEFVRVSAFLRAKHHDPRAEAASTQVTHPTGRAAEPPGAANTPAAPGGSFACRHCHSPEVQVTYGKYGYYFKCTACEGNTPITVRCETCGEKARTRKSGNAFFADCSGCHTSTQYFTNA